MVKEIKSKHGYTGTQVYIAAHSLGGVIAQGYVKGKSSQFKGMILMGSVLLRNTRKITSTGSTLYDYDVPTLNLVGELDGLLRISKGAETYWHSHVNIDSSQKGKFPVVALEGVAHKGFMDNTMLPSAVSNDDLEQEIDQQAGYNNAAKSMVSFIAGIEGDHSKAKIADD